MMRNARKKAQLVKLMKAFHSAKTTDEMLKLFKKMESCFEDKDLILELITLAEKLKYAFPEKVVFFGKRALTVLLADDSHNLPCFRVNTFGVSVFDALLFNGTSPSNHSPSFLIASVLILLGNASLELKQYDECVSYLNWASRNFTRLLEQHDSRFVLEHLVQTHISLTKVKEIMGREDEVVVHLLKILEVKEKYLEEGCLELGEGNRMIYEAYVSVGDSKQALPYCLKALEIYQKHLGCGSKEEGVARIMGGLASLYDDLGEYEKALEYNQLSQCMLKNANPVYSDSLKVEKGKLLNKLGRYEEAVNVLMGVVSDAGATDGGRACACLSLAKAFLNLENFADAKKYQETAYEFLNNKKIHISVLLSILKDMSNLDEMINDRETALSNRRDDLGTDTQKKVDGSEQEYLDEALGILNQMKRCVSESPAMISPQSKDGEDVCETISKCGISDDKDLGTKKI